MGGKRVRANLLPRVDAGLSPQTLSLVLSPCLLLCPRPELSRSPIAPVGFPTEKAIVKKS